MKIAIITAMQEELDSIMNTLKLQYTTYKHKGFTIYKGEYLLNTIIFILSGIGCFSPSPRNHRFINLVS